MLSDAFIILRSDFDVSTHAIQKEAPALCILELSIDHMSGKKAIELVQKRTAAVK